MGETEDLGDWLTEAEAAAKWCPFARVGVRGRDGKWSADGFNRTILLDNDAAHREMPSDWPTCIGSGCMLWRKGVFYADDLATRLPTELGHCGAAWPA